MITNTSLWRCDRCHDDCDRPEWRFETLDDDAWGAGGSEVLTPRCPYCGGGDIWEIDEEEDEDEESENET
jgi:hypothetical protein